jgi:hypothetical protein
MGRWRRHLDPSIRRVSGCLVKWTAVRQQQQSAYVHSSAAASLNRHGSNPCSRQGPLQQPRRLIAITAAA